MRKIILITTLFFISIISFASEYIYYKGNSTSVFDIVYILKDNKMFKGRSTSFSDNIIFTIKDNSIYRGNSSSIFDIAYTIKDNKVFEGRSTSFSDNIIYTVNNSEDIYKVILPLLLMRKSPNISV